MAVRSTSADHLPTGGGHIALLVEVARRSHRPRRVTNTRVSAVATSRRQIWVATLGAIVILGLVALVPRIHQPLSYHDFADKRVFLGIANAENVLSNLGFLLAGLAGLFFLLRRSSLEKASVSPAERRSYFFFFLGVFLTAFGSAYYHLAPDNARLVWDRLAMIVGFMALLAAVISERVDQRLGARLLAPLIAGGIASVLYWRWTDLRANDDLRFYGLVQVGCLVAVLVLALLRPSGYTRGKDLFLVISLYVLAKAFEVLDRFVFALGQAVSGHTLKHLVAALGCYFVLRMLRLRTLTTNPAG